ncbi:MAG: hypothetical protein N4A47_00635 [Clostridia bacterium]|jgi:hypothetical protein|nr:hypothetical protein [Clostridia bacterium]
MGNISKDIKRNIRILFIINILFGLQFGLRDVSTTMQILFSRVGGESLLSILNQTNQYMLGIVILLVGIDIAHVKLKKCMVVTEFLRYSTFGILAVGLFYNMITPASLFVIFLINLFVKRLITVLSMDFQMKIIPEKLFKKVIGDIMFYRSIAILIGMAASYFIIKIAYPMNFVIIFTLVTLIGMIIVISYSRFKEPEFSSKEVKKATFKEIFEIMEEKNCVNMNVGKSILNLSFGVIILYAMLAIRAGYTEEQIVTLGMVFFVTNAVFNKIIPRLGTTSRENIIMGHIMTTLSIALVLVTRNYYLGFFTYGLMVAFVNIGYYGYMNDFDPERKHVYLTVETSIGVLAGVGVFMSKLLIDIIGFELTALFSIVLSIVSLVFIARLDELEKEEKTLVTEE